MLPTFKIQNLAATAQSYVPVTFGQVFAPGDFFPGHGLMAGAGDGSYMPLQVDIKATHADGSVRHAVLSAILPAIGAKGTRTYQLLDADVDTSKRMFLGVAADVALTVDGVAYTAPLDLGADAVIWLSGQWVVEQHYAVPLRAADGIEHPYLAVRYVLRDYGAAGCEVERIIENNWAFVAGARNFTYDAVTSIAGQVVDTQTAQVHYHHARASKIFWEGEAPQINIQHDTAYLIGTGAFANYDQAPGVAEGRLQALAAGMMGAASAPMGSGLAMAKMETTGAHVDIGILPEWGAEWLLSMDARARDATVGTSFGAGSWPIHCRDPKTGKPASIVNYPTLSLADMAVDHGPNGDLNNVSLEPDVSHQPDMSFLAAALTGRHFHLEELQFWAMWNLISQNPEYRQREKGLLASEQVRGQAWGLRTLGNAAYLTPDDDPLKADFLGFLKNSVAWYDETYTNNPNANKLGLIVNGFAYSYLDGNGVAPWQDYFFTAEVGHLVRMGFEFVRPLAMWKARAPVGAMTDAGACWVDASNYAIKIRDSADSPVYTDYKQVQAATRGPEFVNLPCGGPEMASIIVAGIDDMGGTPLYVMGYPSNMQAAIAAAVDLGYPGAEHAWDLFKHRTQQPDYSQGPQFDIIPENYVAKSVIGYVDPDSLLNWQQIATEGQTVEVPDNTTVRFGAAGFYTKKVVSGEVPATSDFFGGDPIRGVAKTLQQLIQPSGDSPMATFKITIAGFDSAVQQLAPGSESSLTSIRARVMSPDGATVLGESATLPYSLGGLAAGVYPLELAALDSTGAVMGKPATATIDTATAPVVVQPPVSVSLPSAIQASVVQEV